MGLQKHKQICQKLARERDAASHISAGGSVLESRSEPPPVSTDNSVPCLVSLRCPGPEQSSEAIPEPCIDPCKLLSALLSLRRR